MLSFKQYCHDQRALTSLSEKESKQEAIAEHKHILFNTRTPTEIVKYESELMHKKAKQLPENFIANKAYEASKLGSVFSDTKSASCLLFNVFNELNRLEEMTSGDSGEDADKIANGENSGAITYAAIKKKLQNKAVKNLQEQNAPSSAYDYAPTISNVLIEREAVKLASITYLVKAVKQMQKSVSELHKKLKADPSKNAAVLAKIRKAKATGNDHDLLQIIAGVLGFQMSNKVTDVTIKRISSKLI